MSPLTIFLLVLDYIILTAAEGCAVLLRNAFISHSVLYISGANFWLAFPAMYLLFLALRQLYTRRMPFYKETEQIFYACLCGFSAIVFLVYASKIAATTSRLFVVLFGVLAFLFLVIGRYLAKKIFLRKRLLQTPVLIIGAGKTAALLLRSITEDVGMGYRIVGLLEDGDPEDGISEKYSILGTFSEAEKVIEETGVRHVFIAAPGMPQNDLTALIYRIQPLVKNVTVVPNLVGVAMGSVEIESLFNEKLLLLRLKNNLNRKYNRILKRIFDLLIFIIIVIPVSVIIGITYVSIKLESKGPAFFNAERIGKNGKCFKCYKMRSMYMDSDKILADYLELHPEAKEEWHSFQKLRGYDPRVTKVGEFIRKYSIDELPQIFNVAEGTMSLVGPRPYLPREKEKMGKFYQTICLTMPGITGLWQVSGRSNVTFDDRLHMDEWYVRNWSLWQDIVLLFKTFYVVLARKGAY